MVIVYFGGKLRRRAYHGADVQPEARARSCGQMVAELATSGRRWPWAEDSARFAERALEWDHARTNAYRDLVRARAARRTCG